MLNVKKEAGRMFAGLGFVLVLYFCIVFFRLLAWQIVLLLICINVGFNLFMLFKSGKKFNFKQLVKSALIIIVFVYGIRFLNKIAGNWAFVITVIIIIVYILTSRWKQYVEVKQHIESMIWGKPLKEFIQAGEKPRRKR